jgi:DNA-binding GntR family transcriptional regulator
LRPGRLVNRAGKLQRSGAQGTLTITVVLDPSGSGDQASSVADRIAAFINEASLSGHYPGGTVTMYRRIYVAVREALLSGVLAEGDLLSIRALAAAFGTSSMPVREALGRLMGDGALEGLPSRAYRVPSVTLEQFRELMLIRLRLEALACEQCAVKVKPKHLMRLDGELAKMTSAAHRSTLDYLAAHRRFHFLIYQIAEMPLLYNSIETLWLRMGPLHNSCIAAADFDEEMLFHQRMFLALEKSDPTACCDAVQEDLTQAARRISLFISRRPEHSLSASEVS